MKEGAIVVLLRNINVRRGLCNGAKLIVDSIRQYHLKCRLMNAKVRDEDDRFVLLPRILLTNEDQRAPFKLCRRQYPVRLAFAISINEAQGQTLDMVGLHLKRPVFSHNQLYVALSRVTAARFVSVASETVCFLTCFDSFVSIRLSLL